MRNRTWRQAIARIRRRARWSGRSYRALVELPDGSVRILLVR